MNKKQTSGGLSASEEVKLMEGLVAGRDEAFEDLCGAYGPLIQSILYRIVPCRNDVDDLRQEVLIAIWRSARSWDPSKGRISSWVASITRNRAIDHVRKRGRVLAMEDRFKAEVKSEAALADGSADKDLVRSESREVMREALGELASEQRVVIELAFLEGLTHVEVAERAGIPLGTAKARIRRGVQTLRRRVPHRLAA